MTLFEAHIDAQERKARALTFETAHGAVQTPIFMPVGTHATVKGILPEVLPNIKSQIVLANTYHLYMRPGVDVIEEAGGVQKFMAYDGPMLTDSGGFQLFSLNHMMSPDNDGVNFSARDYDGSKHRWTPETNMKIQERIGAD
ncbi:MAG: tRNA-guanine transglycosylase, partial [Eggerthellaceae bacterium]|nr:tRNA-guanine transglycosylase [Eggerthellaceae bacterium]